MDVLLDVFGVGRGIILAAKDIFAANIINNKLVAIFWNILDYIIMNIRGQVNF